MRLGNSVAVLGGTGFVGREVAYALGQAGYAITFFVRRPERYRELNLLPNARVRAWQPDDRDALTTALEGHDIVLNLVADQSDVLEAIAPEQFSGFAQHVQMAATRARVRRVLHLSYVEADSTVSDSWARSLAEMEAAMHAINTARVTTFRVSLLIGEHDDTSSRYFAQLNRHQWIPIYRADMKVQPLWVRDFAQAVVRTVKQADSFGKRWSLVGPDTLQLRDMASEIGEIVRGRTPMIMDVCELNARLMMALGPLAPRSLHPAQLVTLHGDRLTEEAVDFEACFGFRPASVEVALASYVTPHDVRHRYNFYRREAGRPLEELPREWL